MIRDRIVANKGIFIAIFKFILAIIAIWLFIELILFIYRNWHRLSTPGNIADIKKQQLSALEGRWAGLSHNKAGLDSQFAKIPEDQRLLINVSVFSTRVTGFMGPYKSGVYDEDNATRLALSSGSRCLVLEIDYEDGVYNPLLVYRDGWGMKRSLNAGSIKTVAKSIAARAFNPQNDGVPASVASDPLFVVLYFLRTPPQSNSKAYLRFLGAVAEQLYPLRDYLVAQTPQGDYRRQALESQLFFTNYTVFKNKIILMTNVDTSGFRKLNTLGLAGELGQNQDLDFMIHVRMYGREFPSPFGVTGRPVGSIKPAAVVTSPGYWIITPSDRSADAVESTKEAWSLVMEPVSSQTNQPVKATVDTLLTTYGVHSIPTTIFADAKDTKAIETKLVWTVKPELLRFIPPKPIVLQLPYKQSDSGGGAVVSPKL